MHKLGGLQSLVQGLAVVLLLWIVFRIHVILTWLEVTMPRYGWGILGGVIGVVFAKYSSKIFRWK